MPTNDDVNQVIKNKLAELKSGLQAQALVSACSKKTTAENYAYYQHAYKKWSMTNYKSHHVDETKTLRYLIIMCHLFLYTSYLIDMIFPLGRLKRGRKSKKAKLGPQNHNMDIDIDEYEEEEEDSVPSAPANSASNNHTLINFNGVGLATVKGIVAALMNLYEFQKLHEGNTSPPPRGNLTKKLLLAIPLKKAAENKANYVDKGKGKAAYLIKLIILPL